MKTLTLKQITDTKLKKAVSDRCKQCNCGEKPDEKRCKICELKPGRFALKNSIRKYCKSCRNGNPIDYCGSENYCTLYPFIPALMKEITDKLQSSKN